MCGRFALKTSADQLVAIFSLRDTPTWSARYNIAPTQDVLTLLADPQNGLASKTMRWGLIPPWARDRPKGRPLINARSETVHQKPSFRDSFSMRRCIVLADGYYEWKTVDREKIPHYIHASDHRPLLMAGIWSTWTDPKTGTPQTTCAILTTKANAALDDIHPRMPVLLLREELSEWFDTDRDHGALEELFLPAPNDSLQEHTVSTRVNRIAEDDEGLIEARSVVARQTRLF